MSYLSYNLEAIPTLLFMLTLPTPTNRHSGELASAAARDVRLYVESTHDVTTKSLQSRKVDISVRVFANGHWNNEICVFEFLNTIVAVRNERIIQLKNNMSNINIYILNQKRTGNDAWNAPN
ncbi:hypothetical protein BX616_002678 [Lobosporangium transversale]|uniref:Uncharacterized protein n=1 Tax=Lobosporangium transversale TaxID=64571 RepID=A0A1Y2GQD5_9FUNG|nr:hypothetical protein BCR41DRAFT_396279 [Lobosporangium transversale]KAF9900162.1 hypothetical protein BX616_002678 [Lobosporangium transversale]ORZ16134.1 hypothetical protein BCR41DRAFT_396279 [Lobosporangium transversale]|eukprot:XP_021881481.1 hypothetical protein BCR41DRAFT_396279 [Lobosporangium transversale]